jgi:3-oxoadipate enol-lactonase
MQRSHVTLGDGCRLAYRFDGPEQAPVIMLSNSLGTNLEMWTPQMQALTSRFRVLRYDSRGHGASDVPSGAYSMDRLGRDVIELLDALGLAQVAFCGLSKGGMVGQWLGYRAPDRVERLILCNTSAYMGPPSGWDDRIAAVSGSGMTAVTEAVLERWFTPEFRARDDMAVADVRAMLLATDPLGYAGCCAAIRDMDNRPMLPLIHVPTLVIAGASDPATPPDHARQISAGIADSGLVILLAAHLSNVEQPNCFTRAVIEFLS